MIPKNVFICDWHYEWPDKTTVYFAMKGFMKCYYDNSGSDGVKVMLSIFE